ncbi:MAG: hypothetical protein ABIQ18_26525 [Umezawaea sp.]
MIDTTFEDDPATFERERVAHLAAERRAHLAAFPVNVRVHLAADNGELLRDLDDPDRVAVYRVEAVTDDPHGPVWSLRALGCDGDLPRVAGARLRHA